MNSEDAAVVAYRLVNIIPHSLATLMLVDLAA
jgi:hypothetical protein